MHLIWYIRRFACPSIRCVCVFVLRLGLGHITSHLFMRHSNPTGHQVFGISLNYIVRTDWCCPDSIYSTFNARAQHICPFRTYLDTPNNIVMSDTKWWHLSKFPHTIERNLNEYLPTESEFCSRQFTRTASFSHYDSLSIGKVQHYPNGCHACWQRHKWPYVILFAEMIVCRLVECNVSEKIVIYCAVSTLRARAPSPSHLKLMLQPTSDMGRVLNYLNANTRRSHVRIGRMH